MMRARRLLIATLAAASVIAPPSFAQTGDRPVSAPLTAQDGTRIDVADGAAVTEIVVVAAWCPPCERAVTDARRRLGALRRDGYRVVLVGVSARESAEQVSKWAARHGFTGPLVYDADGSLEKALGAKLLPWHVVLGRDGKVLYRADEAPGLDALRGWVAP